VIDFAGLSAGGLDDLRDAVDFVRNPKDAIVDRTVDQILPQAEAAESHLRGMWAGFLAELRGGAKAEPASAEEFDPDAVIARYLAERPQTADAPPSPAAARPSFGRKKA
jgi:hypothetical protein